MLLLGFFPYNHLSMIRWKVNVLLVKKKKKSWWLYERTIFMERYWHHHWYVVINIGINSCSLQFSCSVMSDSLWPHKLQHARLPCPSPTPGVHSDSGPSSRWCHPAISSSVVPFSSCSQSLPASESFPMSQLCMRWPKYWSFSFSISTSKEIPGLISFRMDWLDLLAGQGTLKSLLQHHSSIASILRRSAFFTVQLSHPYMTTGKTIALTRWTLVGKVMSLLFNMLSRLVITFLPRSKRLLISWLQSPFAVHIRANFLSEGKCHMSFSSWLLAPVSLRMAHCNS